MSALVSFSNKGVILLPSYNSGFQLAKTLQDCLKWHRPVVIILDASTDGSEASLTAVEGAGKDWVLLRHGKNGGKGACVITGMEWASKQGFTHALIMDADGQHPAEAIPLFFQLSAQFPTAMILGVPIFGAEAPVARVQGRRVGNWWTQLATLWGGIEDSLFGFRLYPIAPSLQILHSITTARRFDFDTELAVRLYWAGVPPINRRVPVFYPPKTEGGVSHFRYMKDNLLLIGTHTRLYLGMLFRIPRLLQFRQRPIL